MKTSFALTIVILFFTSTIITANESILGEWVTEEGRSHIVISECEEGLCGKIAWIKEPTYPPDDEEGMGGKAKVDRENPDPTLQKMPLIGLQIMRGFKTRNGNNKWEDGKIYDPESGNTYKCNMTLVDSQTLNVRGYIGFSWLGRTTTWTRKEQKQAETLRDDDQGQEK